MGRRIAAAGLLLALAGGAALAVALARRSASPGAATTTARAATTTPAPRRRHVRRGPKLVRGPHDSPVPILMYHVLGVPAATAAYPQLFVRPADFAAQMDWLAREGYHAVTLGQVFRYWRSAVALPRRPVVVSFDDGYLSDYTVALPTLRRLRWPGVLNLLVDNVRRGDLTRDQVRALIAAGWEIDAHTITHADLTTLDPTRLRQEVAGSRAALRRMFGEPVDFFCYPAGRYDASVVQAVRAAGYLGATTVAPGLAAPAQPFALSRIRIDYADGLRGFETKLRRYEG